MLCVKHSEPPSPEEAQALLERLARGDRSARAELIERNIPLVKFAAAKFRNSGIEYEELVSVGCIGLIDAIDRYDPSRGALSTYVVRCVQSWILREMRRRRAKMRTGTVVSLDAPVPSLRDRGRRDKLFGETLSSEEPEPSELVEAEDALRAVRAAVAALPDDLQRYLMVRFGGDRKRSQGEAGKALGWSQTWASRRERVALERCKDALIGGGFS